MANRTTKQQQAAARFDKAADLLVDYMGAEMPPMNNMTPQAFLEQLGYVKELAKQAEKVEKILWERLRAAQGGELVTGLRSDSYHLDIRVQERTALNQSKAKEYFEGIGRLPEFMSTTEVPFKYVKEN